MTDKKSSSVEAVAVTQLGSTFAERAASKRALAGDAGVEPEAKQVDADSVEDKAVAKKSTSKKG